MRITKEIPLVTSEILETSRIIGLQVGGWAVRKAFEGAQAGFSQARAVASEVILFAGLDSKTLARRLNDDAYVQGMEEGKQLYAAYTNNPALQKEVQANCLAHTARHLAVIEAMGDHPSQEGAIMALQYLRDVEVPEAAYKEAAAILEESVLPDPVTGEPFSVDDWVVFDLSHARDGRRTGMA